MILVFYARNALNVLVKLLAIKLIRDARNRKYHACCPKKLHKDSENPELTNNRAFDARAMEFV